MSSRLLSLLTVVALVVTSSPASAEPAPTALTASSRGDHFDGSDIALGAVAGAAGLGVGILLGGVVGLDMARDCNDCESRGLTEAAVGAGIGGTLGAAGGIYAYGELSGHDGSFLATLAGTTLGSLASVGVLALSFGVEEDVPQGLLIGLAIALPVAGGLLGYGLSNDPHSDDSGVTSGALVDISREGRVRLAIPAVGVSFPRDGELVVALPLIGGAL